MIIITGDSRAKKVEEAMGPEELKAMKPVFLVKYGAKITSILQMLKDFQASSQEIPEMVVIIGLLCDILEKKKDEKTGWPIMRVKREEWKGGKYPAVEGALQMREEVEEELKKMWSDARIIWVLPFPVDLTTYVKSCASKEVPREEELLINKQSLYFNDYMSTMDKVFQKVLAENVIPWFPLWKDVTDQTTPFSRNEYRDFMAGIRVGKRVPSLYPEASIDGLHPNYRVAQALIRVISKKHARLERKPVGNLPVPLPKVNYKEQASQTENSYSDQVTQTEKTTNSLIYREQASQTEDTTPATVPAATSAVSTLSITSTRVSPIMRREPGEIFIFWQLPCGHGDWESLEDRRLLVCAECGIRFPIDDMVSQETIIRRNVFKMKPKPK